MIGGIARRLFSKTRPPPVKKGTKLEELLIKASKAYNLNPAQPARIVENPQVEVEQLAVRKLELTPHQMWLINTKSMERPFTGPLWSLKDPGYYSCSVCGTKLFTWDHKYFPATGMASFWGHIKGKVTIVEEESKLDQVNYARQGRTQTRHNRAECSTCNSHIGVVFFDGPPPTMLRYSINSASLEYKRLEDFPDPNIARKQARRQEQQEKFIPVK